MVYEPGTAGFVYLDTVFNRRIEFSENLLGKTSKQPLLILMIIIDITYGMGKKGFILVYFLSTSGFYCADLLIRKTSFTVATKCILGF